MNDQQTIAEILVAEDSPSEAAMTREALRAARASARLHTVANGEEALAFLRREGPHGTAPAPDLILLDLNMPRKTGLETLAEIKAHPVWKRIPVIILTASQAAPDVLAAYEQHANCYLVKPLDFEEFVTVVRSLDNFWLTVAKLPLKHDL